MKQPNHNRTLDSFESQIKSLKKNGFNPIAVTQLYFEDTFVFETGEEAKRAYDFFGGEDSEFDGEDIVDGWYYGKAEFLGVQKEYEEKLDDYFTMVYWLN